MIVLWIVLLLIPGALALYFRKHIGPGVAVYVAVLSVLLAGGAAGLDTVYLDPQYVAGYYCVILAAALAVFGIVEYLLLPLFGFFRASAISRVTYHEALYQPFTIILYVFGTAAIVAGAFLPFFTQSEDSKMYRDVATSLVLLFTLPIMIYASTKVIDEEIENRTMLTLMSKPVSRAQVVIGKYFGVLLICFVSVLFLGIIATSASWIRYFDDKFVDFRAAQGYAQYQKLMLNNYKAVLAMIPALILLFFQIATLAAVSVAVSTRWGLAINITVVVILYIVANLARYVGALDFPQPFAAIAAFIAHILPGLSLLDLNQRLIYGQFTLGNSDFVLGQPTYAQIWQYTGMAFIYAILYAGSALSFGVALFRTRELT